MVYRNMHCMNKCPTVHSRAVAVSSCILRDRVAIVVCYQNYMSYCMAFLVVVTRCIILP